MTPPSASQTPPHARAWGGRNRRRRVKQVLIDRYGTPSEVARTADVPDVGDPAPDEVVFDVLAFPINPADMWFCRGSYRLKPPLPATPGAECVGRIAAVGAAVKIGRAACRG